VTAETALADTSIFIGQEQRRRFRGDLPATTAVSYVTVAELTLGVLTAGPATRASRLETLLRVRELDPIPVDDRVAVTWAELRVALREAGHKLAGNDVWIAATAIAHGLPLLSQDGDYAGVPGLEVIQL
jgi:predicted nucleic acid-binding protein